MKRLQSFALALAATLLFSLLAKPAGAVTCTISGTAKIEPTDSFYCDSNHISCSNWREVDLDSKRGASAAPMRYMVIRGFQGTTQVGQTATNANGAWTMTVTLPGASCVGQLVNVRHTYARAHEADLASANPRARFVLVDVLNETTAPEVGSNVHFRSDNVTFGGSTATLNVTWLFSTSPSLGTRIANVYYVMNSAMTEAITWSTNISNSYAASNWLTGLRVGFETNYNPGGGLTAGMRILLSYDAYNYGEIIRHEFGHSVHEVLHHGQRNWSCVSYNFNFALFGGFRGCEYGVSATNEGMADFIAVRSLTTNDTGAFLCKCVDPNNQDLCSELATQPDSDGDNDHVKNCPGGAWVGIGDQWSNAPGTCVRLRQIEDGVATGCDCTSSPCASSYRTSTGWRNDLQVARYFWDMIDANNEGPLPFGLDDTNLSMNQFVATMEGIPCNSGNLGVDGSCHEYATPGCNPAVDGQTTPNGTGTRDSYNVYDISAALAGDQGTERTLNCVQGAID